MAQTHQLTVRVNDREYELLKSWMDDDLMPSASQVAKMMLRRAIKLRELGQWDWNCNSDKPNMNDNAASSEV